MRGGPRTPSTTIDTNLDSAYVENALFLHWYLIMWKVKRMEVSYWPDLGQSKAGEGRNCCDDKTLHGCLGSKSTDGFQSCKFQLLYQKLARITIAKKSTLVIGALFKYYVMSWPMALENYRDTQLVGIGANKVNGPQLSTFCPDSENKTNITSARLLSSMGNGS